MTGYRCRRRRARERILPEPGAARREGWRIARMMTRARVLDMAERGEIEIAPDEASERDRRELRERGLWPLSSALTVDYYRETSRLRADVLEAGR